MPRIAKVQMPDGRIARIEVPDGATDAQVMEFVQQQSQTQGQATPTAAPAAQEPTGPQSIRQQLEATPASPEGLEQAVKTPSVPAAIGGMGTAMTEVGQSLSDWIAKGLGAAGAQGPAEAVGEFANSLEERKELVKQGAQKLTQDWYKALHGPDATVDQEQMDKAVKHGAEVTDMATKLGLGIAGGAATLGAKTLVGTATGMTLEGAVSSTLLGESDKAGVDARFDDRLGDMKLGALFGAATGSISGVFTSARNYLAKQVTNFDNSASEGFKLGDEFDIDLTFGQASGNPYIQNIEKTAQSDTAQKFLAKQANEAGERLGQKIGVQVKSLDDVGSGTGQALRDTEKAVRLATTKLKVKANEAYRAGIKNAIDVSGGAPVYAPTDILGEMKAVRQEILDSTAKLKPSAEFDTLIDEVETATKTGGATVKQIDRWWKSMNDWKQSGFGAIDGTIPGVKEGRYDKFQQVMAGRLTGSIDDSVAKASTAQAGTPGAEGLEALRATRTANRTARDEIRAIEGDFLGALGMNGTPRQVMEALSRVDPVISRQVVKHVEKLDGGKAYIAQLQDAVYDSALHAGSQAAKVKGAQTGDVDIAAFADALGDNSRRSVLAGISHPEMAENAAKGVKVLRHMLNESAQAMPNGVMQKMLPIQFQDVAINAMSQNPGFMARLFAGSIARGKNMEDLFFTPEGIRALKAFRPEVVKFKRMSGARNALNAYLANSIGEDSKDQAEVNFQQTIEAMRQQR